MFLIKRATIVVIVIAISTKIVPFFFLPTPERMESVIAVSGRIEGDEATIAAKTAGRISEIKFREGDKVKAGQIVVMLDSDQALAREEQAVFALNQTVAQRKRALQQISIWQEQLKQSLLILEQSSLDVEGRVREAEARVASTEAVLA